MPFEIYTPELEKAYTVALSKNHLTLNKKLLSKFSYKHVELGYDQGSRTIRVRPAVEGKGLILSGNKIGARGFFQHFNINQRGKYTVTLDEAGKTLYIKI